MEYEDNNITLDDSGITIHRYYLTGASKYISYSDIQSIRRFVLPPLRGKWRLWGSGDFRRWWNLDLNRPNKHEALELNVGKSVYPTITPDNIDQVEKLLRSQT